MGRDGGWGSLLKKKYFRNFESFENMACEHPCVYINKHNLNYTAAIPAPGNEAQIHEREKWGEGHKKT